MFFHRHLPWYKSLRSWWSAHQENETLEKHLLIFSLILTIFFTFFIPPFQKADENTHFLKAVSLASGNIICQKKESAVFNNAVPRYLAEFPVTVFAKHIASSKEVVVPLPYYKELLFRGDWDTSRVNEPSSCSLPFLLYVPAALAIAIPVILGWNPMLIFYMGRLVNAVLAFAISYWAVKKTPRRLRLIPLFLLVIPMFVFQLSSYSKDAFHLAFGLLAFAYLLHFHEDHPHIKPRELIIFFGSLLISIFARPQFVPLVLTAFIIPRQKVKKLPLSIRQLTLGFILAMIAAIAVALSLEIFSAKAVSLGNGAPHSFIYPDLQAHFLLDSPVRLIRLVDNTFSQKFDFYTKSSIGWLGWLEYRLPWWMYPLFAGMGWYVLYKTHGRWRQLSFFHWAVLTLALTGSLLGLMLAMYLYGSPVAAQTVEGLQGRYFLALVPFGYWWLGATFSRFKSGLLLVGLTTLLLAIFWTALTRYYHNTAHYYYAPDYTIDTMGQPINGEVATISAKFEQRLQLEPRKKLVGMGLYVLPAQMPVIKPYEMIILDEKCEQELSSVVIDVSILKYNQINDILSSPIVVPESGQLCVRLEPYHIQVEESAALMLQLTNQKTVVVPLYLY